MLASFCKNKFKQDVGPDAVACGCNICHAGKLLSGIMNKDGGYVNRPPLMDGSNYDYWKAKMMAFIKSLDSKSWKAILTAWEHPVIRDKDGKTTGELKPEAEWTKEEDELAHGNSKALNALFNAVDNNIFRIIKQCSVAKEAWEILMTTHEGTDKVKNSRLQLLTVKFENLMMGRQFNRILKKMDERGRTNVKGNFSDNNRKFNGVRKYRPEEKISTGKDDSEDDDYSEFANHITALTGIIESESDDEELTFDELAASYKALSQKSEKVCQQQQNTISKLQAEKVKHQTQISQLTKQLQSKKAKHLSEASAFRDEVTTLNYQLTSLNKQLRLLNNGTERLDILVDGQVAGKPKGIRVKYNYPKKKNATSTSTFVPAKDTYDPTETRQIPQHVQQHQPAKIIPKPKGWICHYCGRKGHIRPFYFRLYGFPRWYSNPRYESDSSNAKKEWKPKANDVAHIAHTSLRVSSRNDWYFDSGCSRHMTGVESYLTNVKAYTTSYVTFGDGAKGHIKGIGSLIANGLPKLENVLLVEGLTANLICISQLCDQGMKVNFTKSECTVSTEDGESVMKGVRSKDNCYLWISEESAQISSCLITREDEVKEKSDTFCAFKDLCKQLQREKDSVIVRIRSDHGREFENSRFSEFCTAEGIGHEFSSPITPQQNGVVERKNRTIQECARVMLHSKKLPQHFWAEAMNTACYILNRVTLRAGTTNTLYELGKGRKPIIKYFHVFGSKCYILIDREQRRKMNPKSDEGIFLGYSTNSRAYRVYNSRTQVMMESMNVVIDDVPSDAKTDESPDAEAFEFQSEETASVEELEVTPDSPITDDTIAPVNKGPSTRVQKNHPKDLIIGNPDEGITTRRNQDIISNSCFVSNIEPKNVKEALTDNYWITAMQEELNQFERSEVWDLVPRPKGLNVIGTKWVYKNKSDENGTITRNKARLVAQGYTQVEGLDFDETFALVARLESIRLLLGVACILKFKLFQMDVKSAFLNGYLNEEVYVEQPKGFVNPDLPDHVYKLKKALYGLKQAPRAWYERLTEFLVNHEGKTTPNAISGLSAKHHHYLKSLRWQVVGSNQKSGYIGLELKLVIVPDWIAIVGSGYIGLEFSDVYTELGSEITPARDGKLVLIELIDSKTKDTLEVTKFGLVLSKRWSGLNLRPQGLYLFDTTALALLIERLNFHEELKKEESIEKMLQSQINGVLVVHFEASGGPRLRSMNVADSEARPVFGPAGNKTGSYSSRKDSSKPLRKTDKLGREVDLAKEKDASPQSHSPSVSSVLRRHEQLLHSNLSMNASCSSDASTDSFHSRASTGRLTRSNSYGFTRKRSVSKPRSVVSDGVLECPPPDGAQSKKRCAWITPNTGA
ncbi:hypothetical protein TSUD_411780 [Trifolium subterraneum]|uniref:Integrase catalytic domain-containing protein n=1 Tax=Trifolium subterraneum TaxID=3900 RepID=A0A2Z6PKA4_TRISU|nr:hypothetical protein TSUD_411780 [Trifolium subterraneum]